MKFIWEESDIKPGRVVGKSPNVGCWIIGYIPDPHAYTLISLDDGMVQPPKTAAELATHLTASLMKPIRSKVYDGTEQG
jgi:hypothetical protein